MAGNIKVIEPKDNFQRVSKDIIFNEEIDVLTLGVYVKILALGKKWELNVTGLASALHLSVPRVKSVLSNLEKVGYLKRIHIQGKNGQFIGFDYYVGSVPFPEVERTDIAYLHSKKDTNLQENQRLEKPTVGKTNGWKNQPLENGGAINRDYIEDRDNKEIDIDSFRPPFDFRKAAIKAGVEAAVIDAWIKVRKERKAVNTEYAWKAIEREIAKSGRTANECIMYAVEQSWRGFRAEWMERDNPNASRKEEVMTLADIMKR